MRWMNWNCLMILDLLKLTWHQLKAIELFIIFPKSPRSPKSKFRAKSYAQNMEVCLCWKWSVGRSDAPIFGPTLSEPKWTVAPYSPTLMVQRSPDGPTLLEVQRLVSTVTYRKRRTLKQWSGSPSKYGLMVRKKGDLIPDGHFFVWGYK